MAVARPIRMLSIACVILVIFLVFQMNRGPSYVGTGSGPYNGMQVDPLKEITGEPEGYLWRADEHDYAPDSTDSARTNAAIISLVRNEELDDLIPSIRDLERTWNHKFNYPWIFFNDKPFTEEFKKRTRAEIKARVQFELIPADHWAVPKWIDMDLFKDAAEELKEKGLQYADKISYHQMCRWNSGMFYKHPALETYRYYWRVEPKVQFFCDVDYDVFRFMEDRNQTYGFTINLFDAPESIPSLWPTTQEFLAANPSYLSENNMMAWLTDDQLRPDHTREANGYSTCHFWSNFEIGDMDFFRGDKYSAYFDYLDKAGGFFYERWGDAPVHSIGLGLLEDASKVHWFRDIGYRHIPYFNCPNSPKCSACTPGKFYDGEPFLAKEDCRPSYFKHVGTH